MSSSETNPSSSKNFFGNAKFIAFYNATAKPMDRKYDGKPKNKPNNTKVI